MSAHEASRRAPVLAIYAIGVFAFIYLPIVVLITYSFNGTGVGGFPPSHLTLDWYRQLFNDSAIWDAVLNSLLVAAASVALALTLGLLAALAHNRHRERPDVRLFEIGAVITRNGEQRHVAVVWPGAGLAPHWSGDGRRADFFDVKGLVEQICEALDVKPAFGRGSLPRHLVPGRAATISTGGKGVGSVGMLGWPALAAAGLAASEDVYAAELNLDLLSEARSGAHLTVTPPPRYPSIARDISIVVDETLPAETVRGTIRSAAPETLASVGEFDRYQGKGVPDGRVSLSLRLTFRSSERTLTDAEVEAALRKIIAALNEAHNAVQR